MANPRILLISRTSLKHNPDALKEAIAGLGVQMAVAVTPEDAEEAKKLTEAVAQFQYVTAIVADFPSDLAINDDGTCDMIGVTVPREAEEPKLITEA